MVKVHPITLVRCEITPKYLYTSSGFMVSKRMPRNQITIRCLVNVTTVGELKIIENLSQTQKSNIQTHECELISIFYLQLNTIFWPFIRKLISNERLIRNWNLDFVREWK